jgi:pimeloyl-ACP methyl ester carboxylesterase
VAALADTLEIERFSVFGYSGGGPNVLACAQKIPQRLVSAGITAGEGPAIQPGIYEGINPQAIKFMYLAREKPWQFRMMWGMVCTLTRFAPRLLASKGGFFTGLPQADKAVALKQPELGQAPSDVSSLFETCSIAGTNANPYGIQNGETQDHPDILLCRHLRQPWEQFWKNFHYFG